MSKSTPPEVEIRARVDRLRELLAKATPGPYDNLNHQLVRAIRGDMAVPLFDVRLPYGDPDMPVPTVRSGGKVLMRANSRDARTSAAYKQAHWNAEFLTALLNALPDLLSALTPQDDVVEKMAKAICDKLPEATSREGYVNEYTLARACLEAIRVGGGM